MRRGLLSWDETEVPAAVLDARVEKLRAAMVEAGMDALLLYNNFPRPAAVSWLTHFIPYWSQGVLVLPATGAPEYFVSLSKRVAGWIDETSHMGDIVSTPRPGADLAKRLDGSKRIGVLELNKLPGGIASPLIAGLPGVELLDATALFRSVRHPVDETEIALSRKAAILARDCLDGAYENADYTRTGPLTAAIEGPARLAGAEEVIVELAADLAENAALRRLDGNFDLGARYALRVSLAYKGHWVRIGRTYGTERLDDWVAGSLTAILEGETVPGLGAPDVTLEACMGSVPLTAVKALPNGAVGVANLTLSVGGEPHLVSIPVLNEDGTVSPLV
ncbi:MAG: hypothetical protein ACI9JL_002178 [Paracoccaceae bacterium]|jgi:hypothetical protein